MPRYGRARRSAVDCHGDRIHLRPRHAEWDDIRHAGHAARSAADAGRSHYRRVGTDRSRWKRPYAKLDIYRKLATVLAERGIASVRYDKRGVAASQAALSSELAIRFDTYVDDAVAWIKKLRADPRFSRVIVVGHSEGSLIGMIAAQRAHVDTYISLEGAGFPAATVLATQLKANAPGMAGQWQPILDKLSSGATVPAADVPADLAPLFRASVQPYLISWFKYDPRVEIAKVTGPVVVVQGTHDIQVAVADGQALAAAAPSAKYVLIDGMTHVLTDDPGTTLAQQASGAYADAARPLTQRSLPRRYSYAVK